MRTLLTVSFIIMFSGQLFAVEPANLGLLFYSMATTVAAQVKDGQTSLIINPEEEKPHTSEITVTEEEIKKAKEFYNKLAPLPLFEKQKGHFEPVIINTETKDGLSYIKSQQREFIIDPQRGYMFICVPQDNNKGKGSIILNYFSHDFVLSSEYTAFKKTLGKYLKVTKYESAYDKAFFSDYDYGEIKTTIDNLFKKYHEKFTKTGKKPTKWQINYMSHYQKIKDIMQGQKIANLEFVPQNGFVGIKNFIIPAYVFDGYSKEKEVIPLEKLERLSAKILKLMYSYPNEMQPIMKALTKSGMERFVITYLHTAKSDYGIKWERFYFNKKDNTAQDYSLPLRFGILLRKKNIPYVYEENDSDWRPSVDIFYPGFVTLHNTGKKIIYPDAQIIGELEGLTYFFTIDEFVW